MDRTSCHVNALSPNHDLQNGTLLVRVRLFLVIIIIEVIVILKFEQRTRVSLHFTFMLAV